MARGVGRPPKHVISRNSSQEISDGEHSGGSNGENSGMNLLQPPFSLTTPSTPLKRSFTSSSSHHSNYVAPQWLLEKTTAKFFSVPIPGVSKQFQDALEQRLLENGDLMHRRHARKSHKLFAQIKHLQDQLHFQKAEVEQQKEMLAKANSTKDTKLAAMRKQKKGEIEQKLQKLEGKLRQGREDKIKEAEEATRKEIVQEFDVAFEKEEEARKRKRKEEDIARTDEAPNSPKDTAEEPAEEGKEPDVTRAAEGKKKLKSELIQEHIDAANAKTESLTEMKREMIWLMKQVIKAEMKQKLMDPRKKESSN
ncbi:MAG: hypothetical protein SGBAC_013393 [Bacillariaceae sp.]